MTLRRQADFDKIRAFHLSIHAPNTAGDAFPVYYTTFADDDRTNCGTLPQCLGVLSRWSDENPGHMPISVWCALRGAAGRLPRAPLSAPAARRIDTRADPNLLEAPFADGWLEQFDSEVEAALGPKVFKPIDLLDNATSLNARVKEEGWPAVDELRGRFLFFFDYYPWIFPDLEANYLAEYPKPAQTAFVGVDDSSTATWDEDWAVSVKFLDVTAAENASISQAVADGFLVAANVCADTDTACAPLRGLAQARPRAADPPFPRYYEPKPICQQQSDAAFALGVHFALSNLPRALAGPPDGARSRPGAMRPSRADPRPQGSNATR